MANDTKKPSYGVGLLVQRIPEGFGYTEVRSFTKLLLMVAVRRQKRESRRSEIECRKQNADYRSDNFGVIR
ncbi:MAG TPA: hypothetical protein DCE41_17825 [Cytophagales bacterium]|nr:hypothetical protein [Cytophagales bacterium]